MVPRVRDMYDVVTWQAQRRRVAVRLHVEIHTHVEGVSAHEGGRGELGAELGVTWWQQSREWVQVHEEVKKKKKVSLVRNSLSGLVLCLRDWGSVHHCREKWATSAVHWPSRTLPPADRTCSSWTTPEHEGRSFSDVYACQKKKKIYEIFQIIVHGHTPPAARCPPSDHTVPLGNRIWRGSQRSQWGFLRLWWCHQPDWLSQAWVRCRDWRTEIEGNVLKRQGRKINCVHSGTESLSKSWSKLASNSCEVFTLYTLKVIVTLKWF